MVRPRASAVPFVPLALLVACAEPLVPSEPSRPLPAPAAPTATVAGCDGTPVTLDADEMAALALHNRQRAADALPPFCVHPGLVAAARAHAADMLARTYFAHTSPSGESLAARITRHGYPGWSRVAENIAWGSGAQGAPTPIFTSWMNSAGHRANVLDGELREIGIGVATGTFQGWAGARVWTADFGTR